MAAQLSQTQHERVSLIWYRVLQREGGHLVQVRHPAFCSASFYVLADGIVIMHNVEQALPNNLQSGTTASSSSSSTSSITRRNLNCQGQGGGPMYCVDIADSWLASGGESSTIRLWDFTKAAEAAARAAAGRAARNSTKRAKQRRAAAAAAGETGTVGRRGGAGSSTDGCKASSSGLIGAAAANNAGCTGGAGTSRAAAAGPAAAADNSTSSGSSSMTGSSDTGRLKKPKGMLAVAAAAAKMSTLSDGHRSHEHVAQQDRYHRMQHAHVTRQHQQQNTAAADRLAQPELESANARSSNSQPRICYSHGYQSQAQGYRGHCPRGYHGGYIPHVAGACGSSPHQHFGHWANGPHGGSPQQHSYGVSPPCAWQQFGGRPNRYPSSARQQHRATSSQATKHNHRTAQRPASRQISISGEEEAGVPIRSSITSRSSQRVPAAGSSSAVGVPAVESGDSSGGEGALRSATSPCIGTAGCSYTIPFSSSYPSAMQTGPWLVMGSSPRQDTVVDGGVYPDGGAASKSRSRLSGSGVSAQTGLPADLAVPGSLSS